MLDLTLAFASFPVLETERLRLRAVVPEDTEDFFRILGDARVTRYFGRHPMTSLKEASERVERFQTSFEEKTGVRWGITARETGEFLGTGGFWRIINEHHRAEIGYELSPDWWGKGVMPEAVGAMLTFGFTQMGLHSVEAHIHPANGGSQRVLEKLGFVQEGYFRENYFDPVEERFTDTPVFSLLKAMWLTQGARDV